MLKKTFAAEHHLTFTKEDGKLPGSYLTYREIPLVGAAGKLLVEKIYNILEAFNSTSSLTALLVDNTSVNTGTNSGLVVVLEKILGRNLHCIGCSLHQNKLPLRAIFKELDGETAGSKSFNRPLVQKCAENIYLIPPVQFNLIKTNINAGFLKNKIKNDLSNDQKLLLEYCVSISSGEIDKSLVSRKLGSLCHSRWLTLAIRLLALYTREKKPNETLEKPVSNIIKVYAFAWFEIKTSSKLHEAPKILFTISRLNQLLNEDVKEFAQQSIQGNAFCLLPDNFVHAMIKNSKLILLFAEMDLNF